MLQCKYECTLLQSLRLTVADFGDTSLAIPDKIYTGYTYPILHTTLLARPCR